jgi:hypothetical protein
MNSVLGWMEDMTELVETNALHLPAQDRVHPVILYILSQFRDFPKSHSENSRSLPRFVPTWYSGASRFA